MLYNIFVMKKECVLYDRECIDCGECNYCDYNPLKICDNCGKCLENDSEYNAIKITAIEEENKN